MYVAVMIRIINSHAIEHKVITCGNFFSKLLGVRYDFSHLFLLSSLVRYPPTDTDHFLLLQRDYIRLPSGDVWLGDSYPGRV